MRGIRRSSTLLPLLFLLLPILTLALLAHSQQTTFDLPQGGRIVFGKVTGVRTQGEAMISVLRVMHQNCGERPQISQVFKFRDSDSAGLFFTVMNHPAGNVLVAGLIIASPNGLEVALLSDRADRFNQTLNPMMTKLFSVWHPGGVPAPVANTQSASSAPASNPQSAKNPSAGSAQSASAAKLHTVTTADNASSIGIPDGWTLNPNSGHGTVVVTGPNDEVVAVGMIKTAVDPTSQWMIRTNGVRFQQPGTIIYAFRGDMEREFPDMFQAWRRSNGKPPAKLDVNKIDPVQAAQGNHCVHATGHLEADGKAPALFEDQMCALDPSNYGIYSVSLIHIEVPNQLSEKEKPSIQAIMGSLHHNADVINRQNAELLQQKQANDAALARNTQAAIDQIHQIGAQATARMAATEAANDAQHAGWWAQQDSNARNGAGFSNYMRDQTVIRDTQYPNEHATVWNQTANWLQRAFPDRIEEVPTSQYIAGQDY